MFKLIALLLGLGVGFGGGVWYASKHPEWAKDFGAKEEQYAIEKSLQIAKATKAKLDEMAAKDSSSKTGQNSFLGSGSTATKKPDPEIAKLSQEQDANIAELEKQLAKVKK
jgi:hypothetical protein